MTQSIREGREGAVRALWEGGYASGEGDLARKGGKEGEGTAGKGGNGKLGMGAASRAVSLRYRGVFLWGAENYGIRNLVELFRNPTRNYDLVLFA